VRRQQAMLKNHMRFMGRITQVPRSPSTPSGRNLDAVIERDADTIAEAGDRTCAKVGWIADRLAGGHRVSSPAKARP
jgi:hypothetical protein